MSASIFGDFSWIAGKLYNKNDIVLNGSYYYYALQAHVSAPAFITDYNNNLWGGVITYNGITKPHFIWKSSYNHSNENQPRLKKIQFGDGYSQSLQDGINNILMQQTLPFENIDLNEYTAILHFLYYRFGSESFVFVPPAPFGIMKLFKCEKWTNVQAFYNNYTINAIFTEVPA